MPFHIVLSTEGKFNCTVLDAAKSVLYTSTLSCSFIASLIFSLCLYKTVRNLLQRCVDVQKVVPVLSCVVRCFSKAKQTQRKMKTLYSLCRSLSVLLDHEAYVLTKSLRT